MWFISLAIFLLGLIVGSFLNVVIYRYNTGLSVSKGRSMCFQCGKVLHWYELIPVISFVIQQRRCRRCHSLISWQYPAVELLTGFLFLAVWQLKTESLFIIPLYWLIFSTLVVILVYDLRHKIIPDGPVYLFIGLGALTTLSRSHLDIGLLGKHWLASLVFFLVFAALWYFSAGRWMGFGDAKLVTGLGFLLGISSGITALVLAFWSGAIVGIALIVIGKILKFSGPKINIKSEIPFAPFIIFGLALAFFTDINLLDIVTTL